MGALNSAILVRKRHAPHMGRGAFGAQTIISAQLSTVRSRYKRQLIQLNMNKSGLHGLECKTRDPYSLENDSLITRTHCIDMTLSSAGQNSTTSDNEQAADPAAINSCCPSRREP